MNYEEWADYVREGAAILHERLPAPRYVVIVDLREIRDRVKFVMEATLSIDELTPLSNPSLVSVRWKAYAVHTAWGEWNDRFPIDGPEDWHSLANAILRVGVREARGVYEVERALARGERGALLAEEDGA